MTAAKSDGRIPASKAARGTGIKSAQTGKQELETTGEAESVPEETAPPSTSKSTTMKSDRHPFGIRRLDELLDGGLKYHSSALLYGPPYVGKEFLGRSYALQAMRSGIQAIIIHTDRTADEIMERFRAMDPDVDEYAKSGLLRIIDCYTRSIQADEHKAPHIDYVDGAMDLNGISVALNQAQRKMQTKDDHHVVILDSLSTITTYSDPQTAFRFLQILIGKTRLVGGSTLIMLDEGMHQDSDVQMFRHLVDGSIDVHDHNGKFQLRALGLTAHTGVGWIDYKYVQGEFDLTGSFAPGRIR